MGSRWGFLHIESTDSTIESIDSMIQTQLDHICTISAKVLSNYRNGNVKGMVNDTTVHAEKSPPSVSEPTWCYCWVKCMSVCMYHTSTMTPCAVTTTQVILKCLHVKFQTRAMNSRGDHSQTCLFNGYSNGGYHTTPWQ